MLFARVHAHETCADSQQIPSSTCWLKARQAQKRFYTRGRKGQEEGGLNELQALGKHNCSDPVRSQDFFAQCPLETLAEQQKAAEEAVAKLKANSER